MVFTVSFYLLWWGLDGIYLWNLFIYYVFSFFLCSLICDFSGWQGNYKIFSKYFYLILILVYKYRFIYVVDAFWTPSVFLYLQIGFLF